MRGDAPPGSRDNGQRGPRAELLPPVLLLQQRWQEKADAQRLPGLSAAATARD